MNFFPFLSNVAALRWERGILSSEFSDYGSEYTTTAKHPKPTCKWSLMRAYNDRQTCMSSGWPVWSDRLLEVVAYYEGLDDYGPNFFLIRIWRLPRHSCKSQFREKKLGSYQCMRNFGFQCSSHEYDNFMTPCYPFCAPLKCQVVAYGRLKTN